MIYPTIIYIIYYTLGLNRTQLQSLAKNTEILNKVTSAVSNPNTSEEKLILIGKSYTTETLKTALAQSNLKKAQIKTILSASGLHGKLQQKSQMPRQQIHLPRNRARPQPPLSAWAVPSRDWGLE